MIIFSPVYFYLLLIFKIVHQLLCYALRNMESSSYWKTSHPTVYIYYKGGNTRDSASRQASWVVR